MASVTQRIGKIQQPRGGYVKPSWFTCIPLEDDYTLGEDNIHATVVGLAVDYLTRFMTGSDVEDAFEISRLGYKLRVHSLGLKVRWRDWLNGVSINHLLHSIKGLDDKSIIAACKAVTYDVWYRAGPYVASQSKNARHTNPDKMTIRNIRKMVKRALSFWDEFGPIVLDGFTFDGGYTHWVNSGDGDYLTQDTLWDFKVSKGKLTSKHTLQLLMYWIMGIHSGQTEFDGIQNLGVYNPRLNSIFLLPITKIPKEVIRTVEYDVIGYDEDDTVFNYIDWD